MGWIKESKRVTIHQLKGKGIRLRSCGLWLDENGFHPFLDPDKLITPDLEKQMGCTYAELPKEAWDTMDRYDEAVARRSVYARA
jgi:hypothetical protein